MSWELHPWVMNDRDFRGASHEFCVSSGGPRKEARWPEATRGTRAPQVYLVWILQDFPIVKAIPTTPTMSPIGTAHH